MDGGCTPGPVSKRQRPGAPVDDYDALILPGGALNPDNLRQDAAAVSFVRDFVESGKPVGVICHGASTLVEADVVIRPAHVQRAHRRRAGKVLDKREEGWTKVALLELVERRRLGNPPQLRVPAAKVPC